MLNTTLKQICLQAYDRQLELCVHKRVLYGGGMLARGSLPVPCSLCTFHVRMVLINAAYAPFMAQTVNNVQIHKDKSGGRGVFGEPPGAIKTVCASTIYLHKSYGTSN